MAKKQTRRAVSLNRKIYEAAKKEAARRGLTLAAFVEGALTAAGVPMMEHRQQTVEHVQKQMHSVRKNERIAARRNGNTTKPLASRERQMLGDGVANALGFR